MTDLVKQAPTAGVIVLNEGGGDVNMLSPVATIKRASPFYDVLTAVVKLDPARDFYRVPGTSRYAPTAVGLFKLADAAGIEIGSSKSLTPSVCARCRDMNRGQVVKCWECPHQYDTAAQVVMRQQQPDGSWKAFTASYELDFTTVEAEIRARPNKTEAQIKAELAQKRRHRAALAESGAYARCLRKLLNVSTYSEQEIARPFLVHRLYLDISKLSPELQAQALIASRQVLERNRALLHSPEGDDDLCGPEPALIEAPAEVIEAEPIAEAEPEPEMDPMEVYQTAEVGPRVDVYALRDVLQGAALDINLREPGKPATPGQLNLVHVMLGKATGHQGDAATQDRHLLLMFLFGKKSSGDLNHGEVFALLNALVDQARSDRDARRYELADEGRAMVNAAIMEQMRIEGQSPLFEDADTGDGAGG